MRIGATVEALCGLDGLKAIEIERDDVRTLHEETEIPEAFDSVLYFGRFVFDSYTINRQKNYIDSEHPDTTGHGGDVLELLRYFSLS